LEENFLSDIIIKSKTAESMMVVILDQVTDPHNVGAILRSACAFGADAIIVQTRHAPEATGTLAKAACGALEYVPIIRETNLSRAIEQLQDAFFNVIGLDEEGVELKDIQKSNLTCLVMGAEGPGLRQKVKENCTSLLRLPTDGPVPTLNVSNATAVALYALKF
jgi:23S rRNA (guanosine2251-2'-O)-methyltransferase